MHHRLGKVVAAPVVSALVAAAALVAVPTATAADPPLQVLEVGAAGTPTLDLPRATHGRAAVRALGDDLDEAAELNGTTAPELRELLLDDPTMWISTEGRLYAVDPAPEDTGAPVSAAAATQPLGQTFLLHSKPDSTHTIYLDFDGAVVSGTAWNSGATPLAAGSYPGWDPSGNGPTFDDSELAAVQDVWTRIAEDYAPFDVDVTTEVPGAGRLTRSSAGDTTFGTTVLFSPSASARTATCGGTCAGVAYIGTFNLVSSTPVYQPAWVFPHTLDDSPKNLAEAASHEVGHNFGLNHDGASGTAYYFGHANWAPIMGAGYDRPVSQWSPGDYSGATNPTEDDVALIGAMVGFRGDSGEGSSIATAALLGGTIGYIAGRTDQDFYDLGTCTGSVTARADPTNNATNLDLELALLDGTGSVIASANPVSDLTDASTATGMAASVTTSIAGAQTYVRVDGVGNGTASTGYTDYDSLGAYTITVTGTCAPPTPAGAPGVPTAVTATPTSRSAVTLAWGAASGTVTSYVVTPAGRTPVTVDAGTLSLSVTGLSASTAYTFTVRAVNASGPSAGAVATATTSAPVAPGAIRNLTTAWNASALAYDTTWAPPADDGGATITRYDFYKGSTPYGWGFGTSIPADWVGPSFLNLTVPGRYDIGVAARTSAGLGPVTHYDLSVPELPSAPTGLTAAWNAAQSRVDLDWGVPTTDGFTDLEYDVRVDGALASTVSTTDAALTGLAVGGHTITVKARNVLGSGPAASASTTVPVPPSAPDAPTALSAGWDAGSASVAVSWTAPVDDGGAPVTSYRVSVDGELADTVTGTSADLAGVAPGSRTISVTAVNSAGEGDPASTSVVVPDLPKPPTALSAGWQAGTGVTASWTAPLDTGGVPLTSYRVYVDGALRSTVTGVAVTISGLSAGSYTIGVEAVNVVGASTRTSTQVTVPTAPGAPTGLVATRQGAAGAAIRWSAPATDGGNSVTTYRVSVDGTFRQQTSGTSATVAGLAVGRHTIAVSATNAVGEGAAAQAILTIPATVPGAVRIAKPKPGAKRGRLTASVTWSAPTRTGGAAIVGYQVTASRVAGRGKAPKPVSVNVNPRTRRTELVLKPGTWVFVVRARNSAGWGAWSARSARVTPR